MHTLPMSPRRVKSRRRTNRHPARRVPALPPIAPGLVADLVQHIAGMRYRGLSPLQISDALLEAIGLGLNPDAVCAAMHKAKAFLR